MRFWLLFSFSQSMHMFENSRIGSHQFSLSYFGLSHWKSGRSFKQMIMALHCGFSSSSSPPSPKLLCSSWVVESIGLLCTSASGLNEKGCRKNGGWKICRSISFITLHELAWKLSENCTLAPKSPLFHYDSTNWIISSIWSLAALILQFFIACLLQLITMLCLNCT